MTPSLQTQYLVILIALGTLSISLAEEVTAEEGGSASLDITVRGLRSDQGKLRVSLFDGPDGYPTEPGKAAQKRVTSISKGVGRVRFEGLQPGRYAAFAHHDEDSDGEIRSNWIGMPKEGVGASNNAKGRMGPPRFKDASFSVREGQTNVSFKVRYL